MQPRVTAILPLGYHGTPAPEMRSALLEENRIFPVAGGRSVESLFQAGAAAQMALLKPDVVLVRCKGMDPLLTGRIQSLRHAWPCMSIAVTDEPCTGEEARRAGFFGVLRQPRAPDARRARDFEMQMVLLIRNARLAGYVEAMGLGGRWALLPEAARARGGPSQRTAVMAIGASTGGTEAVTDIVTALPGNAPCVLVVQHMPKAFTGMFAANLNPRCGGRVLEAADGDPVLPGRVYIAPGEMQMTLERAGDGYRIGVRPGEKVSGHCPSVDVLFRSVAEAAGACAVGVILTGMGRDGAEGLLAMRRAGAYTIGQDQESSVVYGMPGAAFENGAVMRQLPLNEIIGALRRIALENGAQAEAREE